MHVCMYVCTYACTYVRTYVRTSCMYVYIHISAALWFVQLIDPLQLPPDPRREVWLWLFATRGCEGPRPKLHEAGESRSARRGVAGASIYHDPLNNRVLMACIWWYLGSISELAGLGLRSRLRAANGSFKNQGP